MNLGGKIFTATLLSLVCTSAMAAFINDAKLDGYIDKFNADDEELYVQHIPNSAAKDFLRSNIAMFECPDYDIESVYYFRWWTFRKHIKKTADGFVITEFLPKVKWSGKDNAIPCPAAMHFREGRWLADKSFLEGYARYWKDAGKAARTYSFWPADSVYEFAKASGNTALVREVYEAFKTNFFEWEKRNRPQSDGLFWQSDWADGMELSISGKASEKGAGYRATINSYMYAEAAALTKIAKMCGNLEDAKMFADKAAVLKKLINEKLWDASARFFKVIPKGSEKFTDVRELHGYTPWYFNIPPSQYSDAWAQLSDTGGFRAPYGPTSAEQRHKKFALNYNSHECLWDGPSWPYATSITLVALANLLNNYPQTSAANVDTFFDVLQTYAMSHHRILKDGRRVFWIDENINPYTGEWISRTILEGWKWRENKGGYERGKDYNHSEFCDIVITALVGVRPSDGDTLEVNPLVPSHWDWFCLENLSYRGKKITVLYDKSGAKYGIGSGLFVYVDGKLAANSKTLKKISIGEFEKLSQSAE